MKPAQESCRQIDMQDSRLLKATHLTQLSRNAARACSAISVVASSSGERSNMRAASTATFPCNQLCHVHAYVLNIELSDQTK
jgi:hypothetical protein